MPKKKSAKPQLSEAAKANLRRAAEVVRSFDPTQAERNLEAAFIRGRVRRMQLDQEVRRLAGIPERPQFRIAQFAEPKTPLQKSILAALAGKGLKKEQLAVACKCEPTRLYRKGGINELVAAGEVRNKPQIGYYRPDAPPVN